MKDEGLKRQRRNSSNDDKILEDLLKEGNKINIDDLLKRIKTRFYPELQLKPRDGRGRGKRVIMNAYYKYQLRPRVKELGFSSGVEGCFSNTGDREGIVAGSKIMLPSTSIGGP
ncbi:hypothetical protein Tco_0663393, partial [Tanacetum coccineum]